MRGRAFVALWFASVCTACGGGSTASLDAAPLDAAAAPDAVELEPGDFSDPLVRLQRTGGGGPAPEIQEVRARGDGMLFFCTGRRGLFVVDASNPMSMQLVAQLEPSLGSTMNPRCFHLAWSGDTIYMTSRGDEIQPTPFLTAFDLSGAAPVERGSFVDAARSFEGVATGNGFVYVAAHDAGVIVLEDLGDSFVERGTASGLVNAWGLAAEGSTVYVADGVGGLAVVDASNPDAPVVVGSVATGGAAQSVFVDGAIAWVAAGSNGLVAVDVSDAANPTIVSTTDTPGSALQVAIAGGHAYVADWNDARVFDVSDPAAPVLVAAERIVTNNEFSRVLGIGARDDVAFIGEWAGMYSYRLFPDVIAPDLRPWETSISFGEVPGGTREGYAVVVENQGTAPLVVWDVEVAGAGFSTEAGDFALEPGARAAIEIAYDAVDTVERTGSITLRSDDPDEPERVLPLVANRPGLDVGDAAPEITVALSGGGEWRSSEHQGQVRVLAYFATF